MKMFLNYIMLSFFEKVVLVHNGPTLITRLNNLAIVSLFLAPLGFIETIRHWFIDNSGYVYFVLAAVFLDWVAGCIVHLFYKRDFNIKKNISGVCVKLGMVFAVGTLMEGFGTITKSDGAILGTLTVILRVMVFLYPTLSMLYNSAIITGGKFPPIKLIERLEKVNKNLDLSDFKSKDHEAS